MAPKKKEAAAPVGEPQRYTRIDDEQILDNKTGLIWVIATLSWAPTQQAAVKAGSACRVGGHNDWRLPTIDELLSIVDRSRYSPAIDIGAFPDTASSWYWSSTVAAWSSSDAWVVSFSSGSSYSDYRDLSGFVRAVRSASASQ